MDKKPLKQTLIVLKSKPEFVSKTESDLAIRGWDVLSFTKVIDIIAPVLENPPSFVLICMDHPNSRARVLPKILSEALGINVIVYLEHISSSTLAMVKYCDYILYPPINESAFTRMVTRIERDLKREAELANSALTKASMGTTSDAVILIKGEKTAAEQLIVEERARQLLKEMLVTEEAPRSKQNGPGTIVAKGVGPADHGVMVQKGKAISDSGVLIQKGNATIGSGAMVEKNGLTQSGGVLVQKGKAATNPGAIVQRGVLRAPDGESTLDEEADHIVPDHLLSEQSRFKKTKSFVLIQKTSGPKVNRNEIVYNETSYLRAGPKSDENKEKNRNLLSQLTAKSSDDGDTNLMQLHRKEKIGHSGSVTSKGPKKTDTVAVPMGEIQSVITFPMTSGANSWLVVCASSAKADPAVLFGTLKSKFEELMGESSSDFSIGDLIPLQVQPIRFGDWVKENAECSKRFSNEGYECVVAFIEHENKETQIESSGNGEYISMSINEIITDRKLEFDFFIHMPVNDKFMQYGREGNKISMKQKDKLVSEGITSVHLKEKQAGNLAKYQLQNFLDAKFSEKPATKAKPTG